MLGFVHLMLSYSPLSSGFHSSPSIEFQRVMWHCLTLCLQNTLLFQPPPFSLCFYPIFSAHMHAIWQYTRILSLPPLLFVSLAYSPLDSPLPSVNRECIVSLQILSVLSVGCFVCGNHHDGLKSLWYLQCSQVDASTHSHLHSQKPKGI